MPIEHYWDGEESVTVTYRDQEGTRHKLPELLGDFEDELDAELSAIEHASDLMTDEEFRSLTAKAYQRQEMRERGRQRWAGTSQEERTAHATMMAEKSKNKRKQE